MKIRYFFLAILIELLAIETTDGQNQQETQPKDQKDEEVNSKIRPKHGYAGNRGITHHYRQRSGNAPRGTIYYGPGGCVCYPGYSMSNIPNGTNSTNDNDGGPRSLNFPSGTYEPHSSNHPTSPQNRARPDDINVESRPVDSNGPSHSNPIDQARPDKPDSQGVPTVSNSPSRSYDPNGQTSKNDPNSHDLPSVPLSLNQPNYSNGHGGPNDPGVPSLPIASKYPNLSIEPHGVESSDDPNSPARLSVPNAFSGSSNPVDSNGSPRGLNLPDGNYDPFSSDIANSPNGQSRSSIPATEFRPKDLNGSSSPSDTSSEARLNDPNNPDLPSKNPNVPFKVKDVPPNVSDLSPKVPDVPLQIQAVPPYIPNVPPEIQDVPSNIPDIPSEIPNIPEVPFNIPDVPPQITDVRPQIPNVSPRILNVPFKFPYIPSNVSDDPSKVPNVPSEDPNDQGRQSDQLLDDPDRRPDDFDGLQNRRLPNDPDDPNIPNDSSAPSRKSSPSGQDNPNNKTDSSGSLDPNYLGDSTNPNEENPESIPGDPDEYFYDFAFYGFLDENGTVKADDSDVNSEPKDIYVYEYRRVGSEKTEN